MILRALSTIAKPAKNIDRPCTIEHIVKQKQSVLLTMKLQGAILPFRLWRCHKAFRAAERSNMMKEALVKPIA